MATTLTTSISLKLQTLFQNALEFSTPADTARFPFTTLSLTNGTGANQADRVFYDRRTLAGGANEELDLAGSLVDAFGQTITFARIKGIAIYNRASASDAILSVGGSASNQFINWVGDATDIIKIRPGGVFLLIAPDATGYAVTAGTGDKLKIANAGAGSADYDVMLLGGSA